MTKSDLIGCNRNSIVDDIDTEDHENDEMNHDSEDEDHGLNERKENSIPRVASRKKKPTVRLANSFFQTVFYGAHNGQKKTPLHTMMAHHAYDICKSKELITTLIRSGYSISYTEY